MLATPVAAKSIAGETGGLLAETAFERPSCRKLAKQPATARGTDFPRGIPTVRASRPAHRSPSGIEPALGWNPLYDVAGGVRGAVAPLHVPGRHHSGHAFSRWPQTSRGSVAAGIFLESHCTAV